MRVFFGGENTSLVIRKGLFMFEVLLIAENFPTDQTENITVTFVFGSIQVLDELFPFSTASLYHLIIAAAEKKVLTK